MHHLLSKIALATAFAFVFFLVPHAFAYDLVNIPATIRDNGRNFQVTIVATAIGSSLPTENEGSQTVHAGMNPYVEGQVNGFYDVDLINPAPANLPDFLISLITGGASTSPNQLVEFFSFPNIESITINGVTFIPPQIIAQNPTFQNLVVAALITPPSGLTVVQGVIGARFQGVEQLFTAQTIGTNFSTSDLESIDLDGDGKWEVIFTSGNQLNVVNANGNQITGFPVAIGTYLYGVSVGDINPASPGTEIVVFQYNTTSSQFEIIAVRPNGTTLFTTPVGGIVPNNAIATGYPLKLADADQNGTLDVIWMGGTNPDGAVFVDALDGNGNHLSGYPVTGVVPGGTGGNFLSSTDFAVGNVDGDSNLEAVILTTVGPVINAQVTIFDLLTRVVQGTINPTTSAIAGDPLLFNADTDSSLEIAFISGNIGSATALIEVLNGNGTSVGGWPFSCTSCYGSLSAGDLDGNGTNELVLIGSGPNILAFSNNGTPWTINTAVGGGLVNRGKIIDVDFDGASELIVDSIAPGGASSYLYESGTLLGGPALVTNTNGPLAIQYPFMLTPALPPPAPYPYTFLGSTLGDVDGDGVWEIAMLYSPLPGASAPTNTTQLRVVKIAYTLGSYASPLYINRSAYTNEYNTNAVP